MYIGVCYDNLKDPMNQVEMGIIPVNQPRYNCQ